MANNSSLSIVSLDFDTLKSSFIEYLQNQTVFNSYNFDGAGMNVLIDLLCRNTAYLSFYLNTIASEMFLDSASMRDSIVSRVKELGYTPGSRRSAVANVAITVVPPFGDTTATITIPKYAKFQSEAVDGINYPFLTLAAYTASKNLTSNTFVFPGVDLYEGEHLTYSTTVTPTTINSVFPIPSANVDTTTLVVSVQNSFVDTNTSVFQLNEDITTIDANSQVFFVEGMRNNLYGIYFGDGFLGKALSNGNIIITDYIVSDGEAPNQANTFTCVQSIGGFANVTTTTADVATGGSEPETNEQIKFRAPISDARQNRNVTIPDFIVDVLDTYPNIDQVAAWGGEDNIPPVYGKVFLSLKPKNGFVVTNIQKQRISDALVEAENVVGITTQLVDPTYLYVLLSSTVYYNPSVTTLSAAEIAQVVTNAVTTFNANNLGSFGSTMTFDGFQTAITKAHSSIRNNDLNIRLQKQFVPTVNTSLNYTVDFATALHRGGPKDRLASYPAFSMADNQGVSHNNCYIEEVAFSFTGIQGIEVLTPGSGFTSTPEVTITGDGIGGTARAVIQNGRLLRIDVLTSGSEYTVATINIIGGGGSGATASAVLDQRQGTLEIYYFKSDGEKIVINSTAGTIDYDAGVIALMNFAPTAIAVNPYYPAGVLTISVESENQTIPPVMNRITTIDPSNPIAIQVTTSTI